MNKMIRPSDFNHSRQPSLCESCELEMRSCVESGGLKTGFVFCPHTDSLAVFTVEDNRIVGMNLVGPIPSAIAMQHVERLVEALRRRLAGFDLQLIESPTIN